LIVVYEMAVVSCCGLPVILFVAYRYNTHLQVGFPQLSRSSKSIMLELADFLSVSYLHGVTNPLDNHFYVYLKKPFMLPLLYSVSQKTTLTWIKQF